MRIVALSDQHGHLPDIPACDLLIVAGDVCPDRIDGVLAQEDPARQKAWFETRGRDWLGKAPAAHRIVTWGNHDWCGQVCRVDAGSAASGLEILVDAGTTVHADGTARPISVWATPWTRAFNQWAFMKSPVDLAELYAAVPDGIDILVTHQPPLGYGDRFVDADTGRIEHVGSAELLAALRRIRPKLVVCGHLHDGYGRFEYEGIPIWNVSVVNDDYALVRPPTIIDVEQW